MSQDYPKANARLAEVGRHWADGEVSHETWRRERRTILREVCNKRADVQGGGILPVLRPAAASAVEATSPDLPVVKEAPPVRPAVEPAATVADDVRDDDVLLLALLLVLVLVGAIAVFYLA